jgi:predicted RNA binding protein YcfA (HicA-like mRNA interferase family)
MDKGRPDPHLMGYHATYQQEAAMAGILSSQRGRRALYKLGCQPLRMRGSHEVLLAPNGVQLSLPPGHREIVENLVRKQCQRADISWDEFMTHY